MFAVSSVMKAATRLESSQFFPGFTRFCASAIDRICNAKYSHAGVNLYCENQNTESRLTTDNVFSDTPETGCLFFVVNEGEHSIFVAPIEDSDGPGTSRKGGAKRVS
jgi:hypothetical protein